MSLVQIETGQAQARLVNAQLLQAELQQAIEGDVRFLVWTRTALRNLIESQIYGQYPSVEIKEVPDYARDMVYDPEKIEMWGCHYKFLKPNPFPIRTYVDYQLDKNEMKIRTDSLSTSAMLRRNIERDARRVMWLISQDHQL